MPVNTLHADYQAHEVKAQRVRDAVAGTDAIKAKGDTYLRNPDPEDKKRFEEYKDGAQWLGVTKRTHEWMQGAMFRKAPEAELPAAIEYLLYNADGTGQSLAQFSRNVTSQTIINGRHGVLVEYPPAEPGMTREQSAGLQATLKPYASQSIINWRRNGDKLALVVLRETYDLPIDEFKSESKEQFRVLSLDEAGLYLQRLFREGEEVSRIEPRTASGSRWLVIPFQFVGVVNNDEVPDNPLLLDLADANIGHFRNSADVEESAFVISQPMIHVDIGEANADEWTELNPNGITVGSRRGIQTKGGRVEMVQAEERNLSLKLMEHKEAQMLAIGARLIEQKAGNETAEAVKARSGSDTANLSTVADNVSDALENCLEWAALFMTSADVFKQIRFRINQQFYEQTADPQEIMARIAELDRGLIAKADYRNWRRRTGGIEPERTDEDIDTEAEITGLTLQ
jgi:hypothetical protein